MHQVCVHPLSLWIISWFLCVLAHWWVVVVTLDNPPKIALNFSDYLCLHNELSKMCFVFQIANVVYMIKKYSHESSILVKHFPLSRLRCCGPEKLDGLIRIFNSLGVSGSWFGYLQKKNYNLFLRPPNFMAIISYMPGFSINFILILRPPRLLVP